MTTTEFSNGFDTLVDSYRRFRDFDKRDMLDTIEFDEFEKSFYLTQAQNEIVVDLYSGRNTYGGSFENTEELRRYLDPLVKDTEPEQTSEQPQGLSGDSVFYDLPDDLAYIIYEQIILDSGDEDCANGAVVAVQPMTHDEYHKVRKNPFRGANKRRAIRLDAGKGKVEIVYPYTFKEYRVRYLSVPEPIILENLSGSGVTVGNGETAAATCKLPELLHKPILERAVQMALISKGIRLNS